MVAAAASHVTVAAPAPSTLSFRVAPGSRSQLGEASPEIEARREKVTEPTDVSTRPMNRREKRPPLSCTKPLPFQYSGSVAPSARRFRAHGFWLGIPAYV